MIVKKIIEALELQKEKLNNFHYGQIIMSIQDGEVNRIDYHESYLIKHKK